MKPITAHIYGRPFMATKDPVQSLGRTILLFIGVNSLDHFKMATAPLLHRVDNHSKLLSLSSKTGRCLKLCSQLPHKYMGVPFGPPKILYSL